MQGCNSWQFWHFLKEHAKTRSILCIALSVQDNFNRNLVRLEVKWTVKENLTAVERKKGNDYMLYERKNILTLLLLQQLIFFRDQSRFNKKSQSLYDKKQAHTSGQKIPYICWFLINFLLPLNWRGISIVKMFSIQSGLAFDIIVD